MICPDCNNELPENAKFCLECGVSVSGLSSMSSVEQGAYSIGDVLTGIDRNRNRNAGSVSIGGIKTMQGKVSDGTPLAESEFQGVPLSERYEIGDELGRGGFGVVWKARDKKLDRTVAVKRLLARELEGEIARQTIDRFSREATAIAKLNHRNIVMVYDHDVDAEGHYIVMECVEDGTLRDYLKKQGKKLSVEEAVSIVKGVALGLRFAHRENLVHRDIKPANILMHISGEEITPKITDFGLARVGTDSELSMSGFGMGAPWYMPPEQRRNAKGVNHTADIYALGKVLYELVSADVPDNVDPDKIPEKWLVPVILKCIKTNPAERYFSMDELIDALKPSVAEKRFVSTDSIMTCPSCGHVNVEDAHFCESCGLGLFEDCPECGKSNRLQVQYCPSCGTGVAAFAQVSDVQSKMESLLREYRFSRVFKEFNALPDGSCLTGEKGKALWAQVVRLHEIAQDAHARQQELEAELAAAVEKESYKDAIAAIDQLQKMIPTYKNADERRAEWSREMDMQDWSKIAESANALVVDGEFVAAKQQLNSYLDKYPSGVKRQAVLQQITEVDEAHCRASWQLVEDGVSLALEKRDYVRALELISGFIYEFPGTTLADKAGERRVDIERLRTKSEWAQTQQLVNGNLAANEYEKAVTALLCFQKSHPQSEEEALAADWSVEIENMRLDHLWANARAKADTALSDNNLIDAANAYRKFADDEPAHPERPNALKLADEFEQQHKDHLDDQLWNKCQSNANSLLVNGGVGAAINNLETFLAENKRNRNIEHARRLYKRFKQMFDKELHAVSQKIHDGFRQRLLSDVEKAIAEADKICGGHLTSEIVGYQRELADKVRQRDRLTKKATGFARRGRCKLALKRIEKAIQIDQGNEELTGLRSEYSQKLAIRNRLIRQRIKRAKVTATICISVIAIIALVISLFMAFGYYRFQQAVESKNLAKASLAVRWLPRSLYQKRYKALKEYDSGKRVIEEQLPYLARFDQRRASQLSEMLESTEEESDIVAAASRVNTVSVKLASFKERIAKIQLIEENVMQEIGWLTERNAERLMPVALNTLRADLKSAQDHNDIDKAIASYKHLGARLPDLRALYSQRREHYLQMQDMIKAARETGERISEHPLAHYEKLTIDSLLDEQEIALNAARNTDDFVATMSQLEKWMQNARLIETRLSGFSQIIQAAASARQAAADAGAAEYVTKQCNELEQKWKQVGEIRGLEKAQHEYRRMKTAFDQLKQDANILAAEKRSLQAYVDKLKAEVADLKKHDLATHAGKDIASVDDALRKYSVAETAVEGYPELRESLESVDERVKPIESELANLQALQMTYFQLRSSLNKDQKRLERGAARDWARFQGAIRAFESCDGLKKSINLQLEINNMARSLSLQVDELLRQELSR